MFDVLEHIEDEAAALELIHSLLEPSVITLKPAIDYQFKTGQLYGRF